MLTDTPKPDLRHVILLLMTASALFGVGIGSYDVWPADEPRFAQVAREIYQSGDYVVLRVNGEVYREKPPLLFWAMAAFAPLFGDVTEAAARLPSVIGGVFTVLLTYGLAARMFGARIGLWSALILMTTFRFWWQARTAQTDMLITAGVMAAMYCLWRWDQARRGGWLLLAYLGLAAALYAKGPPALVFLLAGVFFFYRGEPFSRKGTHWFLGCAAALGLVLLWYLPSRLLAEAGTGPAETGGIGENLFRNTIGRLFLGVSKAQPPWYYLTTIPADLLPWTLFLPWAIVKAWRDRGEDRAMRFLLAWSVPALIFFSISIGKRATYLLPLMPIFAIFMARGVLAFMDNDEGAWRKRLSHTWSAALAVLGAAVLTTPHLTIQGLRVPEELHAHVRLFGALLLLFALYAALRQRWSHRSPLHRVILCQMALIWAAAVGTIFPVVNVFQSARAFCGPLRYLAEQGEEYRLYSVGFTREAYIYYAKHFHKPVLTDLIGAHGRSMDELYALAKQQKAARELIHDAVEDVPVRDLGAITPEERAALRGAIEKAISDAGGEAQEVRKVEKQLVDVIDAFATTFSADDPAFFFVMDEDWRWLLPLHTQPPPYHVVRAQRVGSREVLLIANEAGKRLLDRKLKGAALS